MFADRCERFLKVYVERTKVGEAEGGIGDSNEQEMQQSNLNNIK